MSAPINRLVVVGAGSVGRALAANARNRGHEVIISVRTPSSDRAKAAVDDGYTVTGFDAVAGLASVPGTAILLAVPFDVAADVIGALVLPAGSLVIDATNPFGRPLPAGATSGIATLAAAAASELTWVKAFNVLGAEHMAAPPLADGRRPVLPVAGPDDARAAVVALASGMGFDAVPVGGLENAGILEDVARFWGLLAYAGGRGRGVVLTADQRAVAP